jgi:hypothetical protein
MFIGKASAVILGFLLKMALSMTLLWASSGLGGLKIDEHGNAASVAKDDISANTHIVFSNLIVFFLLLAISSSVAAGMSTCLDKKQDKELDNTDDEDDASDDDDEALTRVISRQFQEVGHTTFQEMCKTYIGGSKLIPAWAWKDFAASAALSISLWWNYDAVQQALDDKALAANMTTTLAGFTGDTTVPPPLSEYGQIMDSESMKAAVIAIGLIVVSAAISLLVEDLAHCVGSCNCLKMAFDTWSMCMALAAGWSLNRVVNQVMANQGDGFGPIMRLSYLFLLAIFVHCWQSRLNGCTEDFAERPDHPRLPRICKRMARMLVRSGNFIIAWAWNGFLKHDVFEDSGYDAVQQAFIVTAIGIAILCVWPCCCGTVGGEIEGVLHTTIGINVGWFWTAVARNIFQEKINAHDGQIHLDTIWIGVFIAIAGIIAFGMALEFLMLCVKNGVDKSFGSDYDLGSDDE